MKNPILNISTSRAAMTVGIAFITSVIFVTLVDDFILPNFVVPGDTEALAHDIAANQRLFGLAVLGYFLVLVLDAIIGLALYLVLKPAHEQRARLTAAFRLLYAFTLIIGVLAFAFQIIDTYGFATIKLIGYVFFAVHILVLGYAVLKSGYIPKILGILLILASFSYIVFFVDLHLSDSIMVMLMLLMAIAELSLSIWLIIKRKGLPNNNQ
ncbi:DUF4386 domain-containing protein [Muricauda sp. CAU 1633]|uniref:DUF4386 domain-containing protein n=1 Tax=Allomuricauda sp. CAU 1633 TaxID=2816036 RepID=UPI001A8D0033|nr:DUF4386 domain-containing protein [Muricauda sp. CAU 1633]MBO0323244.1 DUF4386 domain-containing protein [Muricauda sp. CAU 1633]